MSNPIPGIGWQQMAEMSRDKRRPISEGVYSQSGGVYSLSENPTAHLPNIRPNEPGSSYDAAFDVSQQLAAGGILFHDTLDNFGQPNTYGLWPSQRVDREVGQQLVSEMKLVQVDTEPVMFGGVRTFYAHPSRSAEAKLTLAKDKASKHPRPDVPQVDPKTGLFSDADASRWADWLNRGSR